MGLLVINLLSLSSKPTLLNTFSDVGYCTLEATFSFAKWLSYALLVGASGERLEVWEMKEGRCPSDVTAATLLHGSTGPTAAFLGSLNQSGCPFPENYQPAWYPVQMERWPVLEGVISIAAGSVFQASKL